MGFRVNQGSGFNPQGRLAIGGSFQEPAPSVFAGAGPDTTSTVPFSPEPRFIDELGLSVQQLINKDFPGAPPAPPRSLAQRAAVVAAKKIKPQSKKQIQEQIKAENPDLAQALQPPPRQKFSLSDLKGLALESFDPQVDPSLAGLAGLTDVLSGSQFAKEFVNQKALPNKGRQLLSDIAKIESEEGKIARQKAKDELAAKVAERQLDQRDTANEIARISALKKGAESVGSRGRRIESVERRLASSAEKITSPFTDASKQFSIIQDALAGGNIANIRAVLGQAADVISGESGRLTDQDIQRVLMPTIRQTIAKIEVFLGKNKGAVTIGPEDTLGLRQALSSSFTNTIKGARLKLKTLADTTRAKQSVKELNISVRDILGPSFNLIVDIAKTAPEKPTAPGQGVPASKKSFSVKDSINFLLE